MSNKSSIIHTSKGSSSGRLDLSTSKSQNTRKGKIISFYPAPQSLRIKKEEEPRLEEDEAKTKPKTHKNSSFNKKKEKINKENQINMQISLKSVLP